MNNVYTIILEMNDTGFRTSDKSFTTSKLANIYLRKVVARRIMFLRRSKIRIKYLNIYKEYDNTNTIELGFIVDNKYERFDYRITEIPVLETTDDFNKFPIQF